MADSKQTMSIRFQADEMLLRSKLAVSFDEAFFTGAVQSWLFLQPPAHLLRSSTVHSAISKDRTDNCWL